MSNDDSWETIDAALIRMRRLVGTPRAANVTVDLSAVLIVDTIARRRLEGQTTRIADIGAHLSVKPSTASRLVAATEAAGFIGRSAGTDDPRSVALDLTPAGDELSSTAKRFRIGFLRQAVANWDEDTVTLFAALLDEFSRLTAAGPTRSLPQKASA